MPFANSEGARIYYEVEGEGPPLMLGHGLSRNLDRWREVGYAEALRNDFKLVMFDARGHGRSDKPHDPAAYGDKRVDDVIAVLDDLGIEKVHYFGYSMGAQVGFRLAIRHPERLISLVLGGNGGPYRSEGGPRPGRPFMPEGSDPERPNDAEALAALLSAPMSPITEEDLAGMSMPCLLFCGDADAAHAGVKKCAEHMPHARFVSLPGLDHLQASARSDLVLPHLKAFLAEVAKG